MNINIKEKFDKAFPEAKILKEHELRGRARDVFFDSIVGQVFSVISLIIALFSIFAYWRFVGINIVFSIFLGVITWILIIYFFSKILTKLLGINKYLKNINDEEIETLGKNLEKITGIPIDEFLK